LTRRPPKDRKTNSNQANNQTVISIELQPQSFQNTNIIREMKFFTAPSLLVVLAIAELPAAAAQGMGMGSIRSPEKAANRPSETESSPNDCVIVAIASTPDPDAASRRRLGEYFDDDEGETFECEYADGTVVPIDLDSAQLTEMREWLNGKLPAAATGPFKSGEQTLSREWSSAAADVANVASGANGAIKPARGTSMASLVRQNNGRGRGRGATSRGLQGSSWEHTRRRTAEVVGNKYVLVSLVCVYK